MLERSYSHFGIPLSDEVILTSVLYDVTMHPEEQCTQCHGTSFIADVHMDTHIRIQPGSSTERHFVVYNYFSYIALHQESSHILLFTTLWPHLFR